jgi:hypothetical protein
MTVDLVSTTRWTSCRAPLGIRVGVLAAMIALAGCTTADGVDDFGHGGPSMSAFSQLPNMVTYDGREFGYGSAGSWPDGTPNDMR